MAAEKSTLITGLRKGLNWKNFFTCTALAMALLTWGYYAGIVATTVTKRTFLAYMDMIDGSGLLTADAANQLGAMSSIFQGGGVLGVIVFGILGDKSWSLFITKASVRRRCIIVVALAFFAQSTGNLVIQNFGQQVLTSLGYGEYAQLCFQAGWITVSPIFNIIGSIAADYFGRRPLLMTGLALCMVWLSIHTAMVLLYAEAATNSAGLATAVAMFFLFSASYALAGDVCVFIIVGELFPNHLRGRGATIAFVSTTLTNLVYLQAAPTGLVRIGWRFFLLFIALDVCGILYVYLFVPETKGVALEELAEVFGDEVAVHARDVDADHENVHLKKYAADGYGRTVTMVENITDAKGLAHKENYAAATI